MSGGARLCEEPFWKPIFERAKSESGRYFAKVGIFGLAVTAVSSWVSYGDKIANRHESAWSRLRAAMPWR